MKLSFFDTRRHWAHQSFFNSIISSLCLCLLSSMQAWSTPPTVTKGDLVYLDFMDASATSPFMQARDAYVKKMMKKGYRIKVISIKSESDLAPGSPASEELKSLHLTNGAKLVIEGHGLPGSQYLASDSKSGKETEYSAEEIAEYIRHNVPGVESMRVSVVVCSSGLGKFQNPDNLNERTQSLTEHLMHALHKNGIVATLKGRNGISRLTPTGENVLAAKHSFGNTIKKERAELESEKESITEEVKNNSTELANLWQETDHLIELDLKNDLAAYKAREEKFSILNKQREVIIENQQNLHDRKMKIYSKMSELHEESMKSFNDYNHESSAFTTYSYDKNKGQLTQHDSILNEERSGSLHNMREPLNDRKTALKSLIDQKLASRKGWQELLQKLSDSDTSKIEQELKNDRASLDQYQIELSEIERQLAKLEDAKLAIQTGTANRQVVSISDVRQRLSELEGDNKENFNTQPAQPQVQQTITADDSPHPDFNTSSVEAPIPSAPTKADIVNQLTSELELRRKLAQTEKLGYESWQKLVNKAKAELSAMESEAIESAGVDAQEEGVKEEGVKDQNLETKVLKQRERVIKFEAALAKAGAKNQSRQQDVERLERDLASWEEPTATQMDLSHEPVASLPEVKKSIDGITDESVESSADRTAQTEPLARLQSSITTPWTTPGTASVITPGTNPGTIPGTDSGSPPILDPPPTLTDANRTPAEVPVAASAPLEAEVQPVSPPGATAGADRVENRLALQPDAPPLRRNTTQVNTIKSDAVVPQQRIYNEQAEHLDVSARSTLSVPDHQPAPVHESETVEPHLMDF